MSFVVPLRSEKASTDHRFPVIKLSQVPGHTANKGRLIINNRFDKNSPKALQSRALESRGRPGKFSGLILICISEYRAAMVAATVFLHSISLNGGDL